LGGERYLRDDRAILFHGRRVNITNCLKSPRVTCEDEFQELRSIAGSFAEISAEPLQISKAVCRRAFSRTILAL
jgi:hypothetical protein